MTIEDLRNNNLLLFESIAGSNAYGTNIATSDQDLKGVFVLPRDHYYGMEYLPQISDARNDEVYYELGRFAELLAVCNPNMLELLAMPEDCIQHKHPLFDLFRPEDFISKLCEQTFAGFAVAQIKKARGLNKKIANPMDKRRKSVLEFCYVIEGHGSRALLPWLAERNWKQELCGLVAISHMRETYALFYDETGEQGFKGILRKEKSDTVVLSSVAKGLEKVTVLSFNKDGYSAYCKSYKEYWDWVAKRNEARYENTVAHGKNYDTKNMLHTFRLLDMAKEIATENKINVRRPNRDFLLDIRRGIFDYDDLLEQADQRLKEVKLAFGECALPDRPDKQVVEDLVVRIRKAFYAGR